MFLSFLRIGCIILRTVSKIQDFRVKVSAYCHTLNINCITIHTSHCSQKLNTVCISIDSTGYCFS